MIVNHYRKEFMDLVVGTRPVIICNQDVDALCTLKILTNLFKSQGVTYIVASCNGISDMRSKFDELSGQSKVFILLNCGATVDLLETLGNPSREKIFFVMDYHRPIHVINWFNTTGQLRFLSVPESSENMPQFDQIFAEDPDISDDSEDDNDEDDLDDRMERRAERQERRRQHQKWQEKRERILFDYREYSYYARPSALYALEVAWVMSRDDMDSIWCAIVALTDFLVMGRISSSKYIDFASTINDHLVRVGNAEKLPRDCLKIRFERELYLFLYRNWSLYESLKITPNVVNKLRTWTMEGNRRLHQILVSVGLPLTEVKQKYLNMSLKLRDELLEIFSGDTVQEKWKLQDIVFGSFVAEIGFRSKFNALDCQLATLAVLEDPSDPGKPNEARFLEALQILNTKDHESFGKGVEKAKAMLKQLYSQVQMMIDLRQQQLQEMGPFVFLQLPESLIDYNFFKRPNAIPLLVHFLQHSGVRSGKSRWKQYPWIVMIPYSAEYFLAVGVQPAAYESDQKNIFYEVFRVLKSKLGDDAVLDYYEGWVMQVKSVRRQFFVDQILAISE